MVHKLLIRLKNREDGTYTLDGLVFGNHLNQSISPIVSLETHTFAPDDQKEWSNIAKTVQKIIVLVPGEDLLLTRVRLPKLSGARLAKALSFALEDQIAEEPAKLHFATSRAKGSDEVAVAIVDKERMLVWQTLLTNLLKQAYSRVRLFLPDVLALPWQPNTFSVLIEEDLALVRTGLKSGFVIEKESLFSLLMLTIKKEEETSLKSIHIYAQNQEVILTEEAMSPLKQLNIPLQLAAAPKDSLSLMKLSLNDHYPINLLQGEFLPVSKKITLNQLLACILVLMSAWVLIVTLGHLTNYAILQREKRSVDQEMVAMYRLIFPQSPVPVDLKAALQNELNHLQMSRADSAFIRLVSLVARGMATVQGAVTLQEMTFRNNQMMLDLEARDSVQLDKLRQLFEAQGLQVVMGNAERRENGLIATRFTLEETFS